MSPCGADTNSLTASHAIANWYLRTHRGSSVPKYFAFGWLNSLIYSFTLSGRLGSQREKGCGRRAARYRVNTGDIVETESFTRCEDHVGLALVGRNGDRTVRPNYIAGTTSIEIHNHPLTELARLGT